MLRCFTILLFNVALCYYCTTILIVLFNVTLDECSSFLFFPINNALLMSEVLLAITSSCANG